MKLAGVLLALSLALNALLAGAIALRAPGLLRPGAWHLGVTAGVREVARSRPEATPPKSTANSPWQQFSTGGDLPSLIARLRAAGFPADVIRGIVSAQIEREFAQRRKDVLAQTKETPYWKRSGWSNYDAKTASAMRDLRREENATVRSLLGPDSASGQEEMNFYYRSQFGDLAPEKMERARDIVSDYQDLRSRIYSDSNGLLLPSDRKQLAYLQEQQSADLANVLSPEELEQYQLRSSDTASQLRYKLQAFNATEDEFKTIFSIQAAADLKVPAANGMLTPDERAVQKAKQDEVNAQIAAALGPDRYAQYQQDTDSGYVAAARIASRLGLPDNAASQVALVQQDVTDQAKAIRSNPNLASADRAAQLSALADAAKTRVTTILGPEGTAAYQSQGGYWLLSLRPRTPVR